MEENINSNMPIEYRLTFRFLKEIYIFKITIFYDDHTFTSTFGNINFSTEIVDNTHKDVHFLKVFCRCHFFS